MSTNPNYILGLIRARLKGTPFDVTGLRVGKITRGEGEDDVAGPTTGSKSYLSVILDGALYKIKCEKGYLDWDKLREWNEDNDDGDEVQDAPSK